MAINSYKQADIDEDYFGKDSTKEGYLNYFLTHASDDNITPKSYAEFTLRKIGVNNTPNNNVSYHKAFPKFGTKRLNTLFQIAGPTNTFIITTNNTPTIIDTNDNLLFSALSKSTLLLLFIAFSNTLEILFEPNIYNSHRKKIYNN